MAIPSFVDRVTVHVTGGNGGNGCASVHREKFKPLGGPDGGNGGDGGSVILRVDPGLTTLVDYHRSAYRKATNGEQGRGDNQAGKAGGDVVLAVPDGTIVSTADGEVLADLVGPGAEFVAAHGGRGGLGNAALASNTRKAPGFALLGEEGEDARRRTRAQGGRRRRAGRVPERRQVLAGRGDQPGPAEGRRLPVHHPGPEPRGGRCRGQHLHRGRRAGPDRGRQRGSRAGARLPAARRAVRGAGARDRLRDVRARPRPADRPGRDRGRAGRARRARGPAAAGGAEQDRRTGRPRDRGDRDRGAGAARADGVPDLDRERRGPAGAAVRDGRAGRAAPGRGTGGGDDPDRDPAAAGERARVQASSRPRKAGWSGATNRSAGSGRPTSATPRRPGTWPTG